VLVTAQFIAQNDEAYVDSLVTEFTKSLENRGINTYFTAKRYCLGQIEMFQVENGRMCSSRGTYFEVFVLWKEEDGAAMIKKIDNCGLFFTLPLATMNLYDQFIADRTQLLMEDVKPYEVANPENSPTLSTKVHPCGRSYFFKFNEENSSKNFKLYDLTNESSQKNLNFDYNNGLRIVALDASLDEVASMLEAKLRRQF
jgi:hypothetical protein